MITVRKAHQRGHADHGWLDTHHTFSFADYYDPAHMGFGVLRVINEDRVAPGQGFGAHPHRDMEILSVVLSGALEHRDSLGTGSVIRPDEVQRMSAGAGITHSEFNHSDSDPVHFLQIWIRPERTGLEPGYEQRRFPVEGRRDRLALVASRDGREGSVTVHQDVAVYRAELSGGARVVHDLASGRRAWIQAVRGRVQVGEVGLEAGDGLGVTDEARLEIAALAPTDLLLFDLP